MTTFTEIIEYVKENPQAIGLYNPLLYAPLTSESLYLKYIQARDDINTNRGCISNASTPEDTIDLLQILACFYEEV
jgi:hypothetical protein